MKKKGRLWNVVQVVYRRIALDLASILSQITSKHFAPRHRNCDALLYCERPYHWYNSLRLFKSTRHSAYIVSRLLRMGKSYLFRCRQKYVMHAPHTTLTPRKCFRVNNTRLPATATIQLRVVYMAFKWGMTALYTSAYLNYLYYTSRNTIYPYVFTTKTNENITCCV
jgi:hypothetical protein